MRKPELPGLTGVRFYAALLVYLSHVVGVIPGMQTMGGTFLIFNVGVVGVGFFFVLSGFILTYNYADTFSERLSYGNYRTFVWARFTKIYPVYLLGMTIGLPMEVLSPHLTFDWWAVPIHVFLFQTWWPGPEFFQVINGAAWALSCEWFFYLLAPLCIFAVLSERYRWIPLGVTVGYMVILWGVLGNVQEDAVRQHFVAWFAPSRVLEFLAGVYLARVYLTAPAATWANYSIVMQLGGILLIAGGAIYRQFAPWPLWGGWLYTPGSLLLIFGLAYGRGPLVAHLNHPWIYRLGVASFAFYLLHGLFLRATKAVFNYVLGWQVESWAVFGLMTVGLFLVYQACSMVVCYRLELPVQQRLRSLYREKIGGPRLEPALKGTE